MTTSASPGPGSIVVGVSVRQPENVVVEAARLATGLGVELVCAHVDVDRFTVSEGPDGRVVSAPIDPDGADSEGAVLAPGLADRLAVLLDPTGVRWSTRVLAGDVAGALAHLAESVDAAMIVVGARARGLTGGAHELFNRSVAVHLAHRQGRPVVVVPAPGGRSSARATP